MKSKPSPGRHRAEDRAWTISSSTRQGAQEADACMAPDDWLYASPAPPPRAKPQPVISTPPLRPPAR